MKASLISLVSLSAGALIACGGGAKSDSNMPGGTPQSWNDQVASGRELFAAHCASCHGAGGEGTSRGPRVVGLSQGALPLDPPPMAKVRKMKFETAADVAQFVMKEMPMDKPGSLSDGQYLAILAFDLHANGVALPPGQMLDASTAKDIVLHK